MTCKEHYEAKNFARLASKTLSAPRLVAVHTGFIETALMKKSLY